MDLQPELQLKSALTAMKNVVVPAVDPHNKLAQEQARIIMGMLDMMIQQLPLAYRYEVDQLARSALLAEKLLEKSASFSGAASDVLRSDLAHAQEIHQLAKVEPNELREANLQLQGSLGWVLSAYDGELDGENFSEISKLVLEYSEQQLLRDRSWLKLQGWEKKPESLPDIHTLLPASLGVEKQS